MREQKRVAFVWLRATHWHYSLQAPYAAGIELGHREKNNPAHQRKAFISQEETVQETTLTHVPRRAMQEDPKALTELGKENRLAVYY